MEISIGNRINLKRDFVKKFELDSKVSRGFKVIAITDVAVGLKNLRNNKTYTLSLATVAKNMEPVDTITMPRGKVVLSVAPVPIQPPIDDNDVLPIPEPTPEGFTHIAQIPSGGIKIKRINAITQIVSGDDPFSDLYS